MTSVLIDTNVVFTYLSGRTDPQSEECARVLSLCAAEKLDGYIALHSLSTIWYLTRKAPDEIRRSYIRRLCAILTVCGADNEALLAAVNRTDFKDFEDAMQDCCAVDASCDFIITNNVRDYTGHSTIPAMTPGAFLARFDAGKRNGN